MGPPWNGARWAWSLRSPRSDQISRNHASFALMSGSATPITRDMKPVRDGGRNAALHRPPSMRFRAAAAWTAVAIAIAAAVVSALIVGHSPGLDVAVGVAVAEFPLLCLVVVQRSVALRRLDDAVRSSHGFERGFDDAAIGMVMVSRDMQMLRVNGAFCELLSTVSRRSCSGVRSWTSRTPTTSARASIGARRGSRDSIVRRWSSATSVRTGRSSRRRS